ncbi:hypothetical protein RJ641_019072, partial [Dillenia turbinata]
MTDTPSADGSKRRWPQMVGLSVLACALGEFEKGKGPRRFSYADFSCATKNFSEKEKFGEEGFGAAFKSLLKDSNVYVAVKRVSRGSKQGIKEIASEVKIISHLRFWFGKAFGKESQTTVVTSTIGHVAPKCLTTDKSSKQSDLYSFGIAKRKESDVYSFGVVCLEIASGKRAISPTEANGMLRLVEWVWELHGRQDLKKAADPKLREEFDEKQMERLIIVGL